MRTLFLVALSGAVLSLLCVIGWFAVVGHKVHALHEQLGADLSAEPFKSPRVKEFQRVDLGYVTFNLPATFQTDISRYSDSNSVVLAGSPEIDFSEALILLPPFSGKSGDVAALISDTAALSGQPIKSWFELKKRALEAKPFSVWEAFIKGRQWATSEATFLTLAKVSFPEAKKIEIAETDSLGLFIEFGNSNSRVTIYDKASGMELAFLSTMEEDSTHALADALHQGINPRLGWDDSETVAEFLLSRDIPIRDP